MKKKKLIAILLTLTLALSTASPAFAGSLSDDSDPITYGALAKTPDEGEGTPANEETPDDEEQDEDEDLIAPQSIDQTLGEALKGLFLVAGLKETQLGSYADCVALADSLGMLDKDDCDAGDPVTTVQVKALQEKAGYKALVETLAADELEPLFVNGMAQPIFPYTTGSVTEGYSNEDSDIIRFFVYVETNYDTDGDGKLDLVKALVQLPKAAAEGDYQAATIYEARPYITGCTELDYSDAEGNYDINKLYDQPNARDTATSTIDSWEDAETFYYEADSSDWYYASPWESSSRSLFMDYEDLDWYDYYLVRGFAVVECGGLGTRDSEGFETCGSDLEIDAFKCVIEWLNGEEDRVAYTDKDATTAIEAYWSNGKVGMTGRSYSGTTQFGLAATGVEGLETIVPVAGIASWYEYTNSQGIATSAVAYTDSLAAYCAGRYLDSQDAADYAAALGIQDYKHTLEYDGTIAETYPNYLAALAQQQIDLNGDYASTGDNNSDTWAIRDYTTEYGQIADDYYDHLACPALIVHGLNDENVKTKQFDLMYQTYKAADVDVKLLLHQDGHLTPTYPSYGYAFEINGMSYDALLNQWFSHYLYDVDNDVEEMAEVTAQDSHDPDVWHTYDHWSTNDYATLTVEESGTVTLSSDYADSGLTYNGWEAAMLDGSTGGNVLYTTSVNEDMVIKGAVEVSFDAAVEMEDLAEKDALMVAAMLVDLGSADSDTFKAINKSGSYVAKSTVKEDGAWMGGGLNNFDLVKLTASDVDYKIIAKGWMDLCNPDAGYASSTASTKVALDGSSNSYTLYLQPNLYTVESGHTLGLVICPLDLDYSDYYSANWTYDGGWKFEVKLNPDFENYTIKLDNSSVEVKIPVNTALENKAAAMQAAEVQPAFEVTLAADHGTISGDVESGDKVLSGTEITLTATANSGYSFSHWTINGVKDTETGATLTVTADKALSIQAVFTKNSSGSSSGGSSKPAVDPAAGTTDTEPTFTDVPETSYFAKAVVWAAKQGITGGITADTFGPYASCTRAQIVTFLWRAAGCPEPKSMSSLTDVSANAYYAKAVAWAVENGITNGFADGTFGVDTTCTRAQAMAFLFRYAAANGMDAVTLQELVSGYGDAASVPGYALSAFNWALANEIVQGNDGDLMPNNTCTRAQIVTFLYRFLAD